MKKSNLSVYQWCDEWPESRQNQFSYEAKNALYNYLNEYKDQTDEEIEVDIVALCCEYTEYSDMTDYLSEHSTDIENNDDFESDDEYYQAVMEDLEAHTTVIPCYNSNGDKLDSFIIQDF